MPVGPRGERRPVGIIATAVVVAKIATGELTEEEAAANTSAAVKLGKRGGRARAESLTPARRKEIAKNAAMKRWRKKDNA